MTPARGALKPTSSWEKRFLPMTKNEPRKALGKGLHALLPTRNAPAPAATSDVQESKDGHVLQLPIDSVHPNPNQPRQDFDRWAMEELSRSIERDGIIQPILVRKT